MHSMIISATNSYRDVFASVVKDVAPCCYDSHNFQHCPDQYVGLFKMLNQSEDNFDCRTLVNKRPSGLPCLFLILESPHIEELKHPVGPAQGKTGKNIRSYLGEVLVSDYSRYGVILMNAINFQCSLGMSTKIYRDDVFTKFWEIGGMNFFLDRLKEYFCPGDVIVNCCTKGVKKGNAELRILVQRALVDSMIPDLQVIRRTHPSSWFCIRNRRFEWAERFDPISRQHSRHVTFC